MSTTAVQHGAHTVELVGLVGLVRSSGQTTGQACRDLDPVETAVRRQVQQAEIDTGRQPGLTTAG